VPPPAAPWALHPRAAVVYVAGAVILAIAHGLQAHHVDWYTVGAAGLTAMASLCASILNLKRIS